MVFPSTALYPGASLFPQVDLIGASAYEIAVTNGFVGTEAEWLDTLRGDRGILHKPDSVTINYKVTEPGYHEVYLYGGGVGNNTTGTIAFPGRGVEVGERVVLTIVFPEDGGTAYLAFDTSVDMGRYLDARFPWFNSENILVARGAGKAVMVTVVWAGDWAGWVCESLSEVAEPYRRLIPANAPSGVATGWTAGSHYMRGVGVAASVPLATAAYVADVPAGVRALLTDRVFVGMGRTIHSIDYVPGPGYPWSRQVQTPNASGLYLPGDHPGPDRTKGTIMLTTPGFPAVDWVGGTTLHEFGHAVDLQYATLFPSSGITLLSGSAGFQAIYLDAVADTLISKSQYGFTNQFEFLAETLSAAWMMDSADSILNAKGNATITNLLRTPGRISAMVAFYTSAGVMT